MTFGLYYDGEWMGRGAYFAHHRERFMQTWLAVEPFALERGRVLDAGGVGPVAAYLGQLGWDVQGTNVDLRGSLPLPDGSFDLVLCTEVIEHIKDIESSRLADLEAFNYSGVSAMLREFRRVMAPQGRLLVTTPNASSWHMLSKWLNGELLLADPAHVREFTPAELERVARGCALRLEWLKSVDSWHQGQGVLMHAVARLLREAGWQPGAEREDNLVALFRPD
jgi:SAM-dependent methyltransferase